VGGTRIIDRVANALSAVTSELIVITSAPGADQWLPGVRVIADAWRKQASLVGIHTALSYARQPILIVAWDMPFVSRPLLELIAERSARSPHATIPESAPDQLEPFCALYTPECLPIIEAQLAVDDVRLSRLLELLPSFERIPVSDVARIGDPARLFFNVNTAEDLAAAEQIAAKK
jgi:molybdopterin-guanine dinucleotide biosynthesis protein A